MKRFSEFIIEKLKVSNNNRSYDVTLESLIKALKDYKDRKHYEYSVYVDLKEIGKDGRPDKDMLLRAGDVVWVPETWY